MPAHRMGRLWKFKKEDVESAVKFYIKYRNYKAMLRGNEKDAWEDWIKSDYFKTHRIFRLNKEYLLASECYTDWLFEYCFRDVI